MLKNMPNRLDKPTRIGYNISMSKNKRHKRPSAIHLAGLQAPARTIQSKPKVASKQACRKNKWGRYDD